MMQAGLESQLSSILGVGASIPFGLRGLVHVWGRNDMATAQQMGIYWQVKGPDGVVAETYSKWEDWPYSGAGVEKEFIGGRFDLKKAGDWTITIQLNMNPGSPVVVDRYDGILCRVAEQPWAGKITRKELEYDSARGAIPVS